MASLKSLTALAIAAALLLAVGVGVAGAHKASFASQVTIDGGGPKGAEGNVSSSQAKCLKGRYVVLYVLDPVDGELLEIDVVTTDADGDWEVEENLFAGEYVAKVRPRRVTIHGKPHRCRGDLSLRMML
jgi:hypothetical protein